MVRDRSQGSTGTVLPFTFESGRGPQESPVLIRAVQNHGDDDLVKLAAGIRLRSKALNLPLQVHSSSSSRLKPHNCAPPTWTRERMKATCDSRARSRAASRHTECRTSDDELEAHLALFFVILGGDCVSDLPADQRVTGCPYPLADVLPMSCRRGENSRQRPYRRCPL
jgi:hypothetical protein